MRLLKLLICIAALFVSVSGYKVMAVPVYPEPFKITQRDGSTLTIRAYGDEFFHYATTIDGYNVVRSEDGLWYYAELVDGYKFVATKVKAKDAAYRGAADRAVLSSRVKRGVDPALAREINRRGRAELAAAMAKVPRPAGGARAAAAGEKFKSLVILVNFSDLKFTKTNGDFDRLLNQPGYAEYGGTGSAADYYRYNSSGKFDPEFVVVGPYTLNKTNSFYASSYENARIMAREAAEAAYAAGVDMGQFVAEGNTLRDIFVFYPGHAISGGGTIWPHRWVFDVRLGSYYLYGYACGSELRDESGNVMESIGTFCHEFGHVLGWPDLYDTDYPKNGQSDHLDRYSVMASGCYNPEREGCTPPSLNALEKQMQGWITPAKFSSSGKYVVKPISEDEAYIIETSNPGEYFLVETRGGSDSKGPNVWDRQLSEMFGIEMPVLMVYHVDQSDNSVSGYTANDLWQNNMVNAFADHECMKVVKADKSNTRSWSYPGWSNITHLNSASNDEYRAWSGKVMDTEFKSISQNGNNIVLDVYNRNLPQHHINIVAVADTHAEFEWNSFPHTGVFTVELSDSADERLQQFETTEKSAAINMLRASTGYKLKVTAQGGTEQSDEVAFETMDTSAPFPYLIFNSTYMVGTNIPLRLAGITAPIKSFEWRVDGADVDSSSITATKGTHAISVKVTWSDGNMETFAKTITVQ